MPLAVHARSKVSRGKPPSELYQAIARVAVRFQPHVRDAFIQAILKFQKQIDEVALQQAIASANLYVVESAVATGGNLASILEATDLEQALRRASGASGTVSADVLADFTGIAVEFNALHPNVVMYARQQAADLVVAITDDVREAIRVVLAVGQEQGLTVVQQAKAIREIVGLPPNWAAAPTNLGNELRAGRFTTTRRLSARDKKAIASRLAKGPLDPAFIAQMETKYAESLLERRALNIARTETQRAAHHGNRQNWRESIREGILPKEVRRTWIVTPDDRLRPEHAAVPGMNPEGVPIDGYYRTPLGNVVGPPLDVNCRCGEGLIFPNGAVL